MHTQSRRASAFILLYLISTGFYANRILTRFIFQSCGKYAWMMIWLIALLVIIFSIPLYHLISRLATISWQELYQKHHFLSLIVRSLIVIYLMISSFLCLTFLVSITNSSWLPKTPFSWIVIPLLLIIYYVLYQGIEVLLRISSLFFFPIIIQYMIFVFSKNKAFDLYALIPFQGQYPENIWIALIAGLNIVLDLGLCLFYFQECQEKIKKMPFFFVIAFHVFSLCYDSFIAAGQFGILLSDFPFAYYESWRIINFGQYIVYLDIFSFFYWVTSAFCRLALSLWLIQSLLESRLIYHASHLILWFCTVYALKHAPFYTAIRVPLLIICVITLFGSLIIHIHFIRKQEAL